MKSPTVSQTRGIVASLVLEPEHLLRVPTPDDDEIVHEKGDNFAPWLTSDSTVDVLSLINIKGDSNLQENIRTLCTEFKDIFSNELPAEPAEIEPFNLVMETEKWRVPSNRLPPRPQSALKQAELVKTPDMLKKGGIIELSQASHYSQALLVPKPDGSSRMCINYIALNACTPAVSFPMPNIRQLFVKMGTKNPTIFGVMDLTQGYHQARAFKAFII